MRYVILVLFTVLCFFSNSNIKAAAQNHAKIFGGTKDDLDQKPEQINNLDTSKITIGPININGYFHFFFSSTSQEEIYNIKDANGGMENEGALNFLYTNEIDNENKFSINFNIKKKFSNKIRFRTSFKYQNENFGDLELSNYSRIQDDLMVNTYWIKAGSNGAWDRSINTGLSILNDNRDTSLINKILTGYDTSETFGGDVDSANLAYYIKPLECLTLGISYSPKTYTGKVENDFFNYKNIIKAGAIYNYDLNDNSNIKLSILGEHGTPAQNPHNIKIQSNLSDLNAINFGGLIKYMNLSIAGTIGIWGKSGMYKNIPINTTPEYTTPRDTHYFDIAASYNINEKTTISASYFKSIYAQNYGQDNATSTNAKPSTNSKSGESEFENISLALDYKIFNNDYIIPYMEINKFKSSDNSAILKDVKRQNNDGWVVAIGSKSKF